MRRALHLAAKGRGRAEPNPLVGAVLVRHGKIVGEGYHRQFGGAHAEINAIVQAGEAARRATLHVTLEPCCHTGKTGPCTEALIAAGVTHVVAAMADPCEKVSGEGFRRLQDAGITVEVGLLEAEARELNAPYLKLLATGMPYVYAKWAMTLDGKIATATGESRWISGPPALRLVHELRGRMDAILVGIGTVLADDPLLTARPAGSRTPLRVILDSSARLPLTSQLVRTSGQAPVLVAATEKADTERLKLLRAAGCECLVFPEGPRGPDLDAMLHELGRRRLTNVLVEGGSHVLGSFLDAGQIDEVHAFVAGKLIGGATSPTPIAGSGFNLLSDAPQLRPLSITPVGHDYLIRASCPSSPSHQEQR